MFFALTLIHAFLWWWRLLKGGEATAEGVRQNWSVESEKGIFSRGGKESARNAEDTPQPKLSQKKTQLFPFIFMPQLLLLLLLRDYSMYIYRKYYFSPIPLRAAAGVPFSRIFLKWSKIRVKGYLRVVERESESGMREGGSRFLRDDL